MTSNFQPLYDDVKPETFDIWDVKGAEPEPAPPEIDVQAELAKECERLRELAKEEGYQEGLQLAALDMKKKQTELSQWIEFLQKPVILVDKLVSQEILQTILWLCECCIGIELSVHPEQLAALIETIKKELPALQGVKQLSMNPLDVEHIKNSLADADKKLLTKLLVADPELNRGDFYLKSDYNELDARLKTRLQTICQSYLYENIQEVGNDESDEPRDN